MEEELPMLGGEVGLAAAGLFFGPFKVGLLGGALVCGGCTSALGSLQVIPQESFHHLHH